MVQTSSRMLSGMNLSKVSGCSISQLIIVLPRKRETIRWLASTRIGIGANIITLVSR